MCSISAENRVPFFVYGLERWVLLSFQKSPLSDVHIPAPIKEALIGK